MENGRLPRFAVIFLLFAVACVWMFTAADGRATTPSLPQGEFIATSKWLKAHVDDANVLLVDVRQIEQKKMKEGKALFIPGAINLPWKKFRYHDAARGVADAFVGIERAQEILGQYGVARTDTVVLYDSIAEDGGATASYLFWVLDMLGHEKIKVLDGGIDAWIQAGGKTVGEPRTLQALDYQAPSAAIKLRSFENGGFIAKRLGDPHYQIIDARSEEEYLGQKPNVGLSGAVLKLGHIPTAINIDYRLNWADNKTKAFRSYPSLLSLYKGLDPQKAVIVYCHSGRRSSFTYLFLRAMGFRDVILYEKSWNEWGSHSFYFPMEQRANVPKGEELPTFSGRAGGGNKVQVVEESGQRDLQPMKGGYISCGG
ncbi:MAG: sulfurtransferase [Desulfurivibrionaceae bacterium]|nr:sulfurtransferase [Desulfurivibrionaceae bacterium]